MARKTVGDEEFVWPGSAACKSRCPTCGTEVRQITVGGQVVRLGAETIRRTTFGITASRHSCAAALSVKRLKQ